MSFFRRKNKPIFSDEQTQKLVNAIREAELQTSGEVRVYVERHCKYVDAIDRAGKVFDALEMDKTDLHNGVLFYVATVDRQIAIYADKGIHEATGRAFWNETLENAINIIKKEDIISGLCNAIQQVGAALHNYFPYNKDTDKNELPDDIVFGS